MTDKEAIEYARIALWSTRGVEAFAVLSELAEENAALKADVKTFKACWDEACNDIAALKHIIDCANTPLMADVLRERDELKAEVVGLKDAEKRAIHRWYQEKSRAEKAEGEVEKARRKIRALERAITETGQGDSRRIQSAREAKEKP
jgi:DNA repair exonuclease SbcCD ATPase subunit